MKQQHSTLKLPAEVSEWVRERARQNYRTVKAETIYLLQMAKAAIDAGYDKTSNIEFDDAIEGRR